MEFRFGDAVASPSGNKLRAANQDEPIASPHLPMVRRVTRLEVERAGALLQMLEQRSKRQQASGRLEAPEQIQKRPADERNQGVSLTQSAGQYTAAKG